MTLRKRSGFTLLDVALAAVILIVGTLGMGKFYGTIGDQLNPRGSWGGLRRYLLAEEMLRAQAEGLRVLQQIPDSLGECKLVTEPPNMGYSLTLSRTAGPSITTEQLYYFDINIAQNSEHIGSLSISTVRAIGTLGGQDAKIGL